MIQKIFVLFLLPMQLAHAGLDAGYHLLYELRFADARQQFLAWQQLHPDDPMGPVSVAASYLFEELYHHGVLTSEYFLDDKRFLTGIEGAPEPAPSRAFNEANQRARNLALSRLKSNPNDADALLALIISTGMQSNFESILLKRPIRALRLVKEAEGYGNRLLRLRPDAADAWLPLGAANYIIGSLPVHQRFFLWFGGFRGDRRRGMEQLRVTAEKGHYLRPFARILLGLTALREKQDQVALREFSELAAEFPENQLFAAELAKLKPRISRIEGHR